LAGIFDLIVDVHGQVLSIYLGLVVLVRVVFGLVILGAGPWLVFVTDKELVEDLQKLLDLIKGLEELVLLVHLSVGLFASGLLPRFLQQLLVEQLDL